jgi:hypothetical protein
MSGGGGKSGSDVTETTIPDWIKNPAINNLQRAEDLQRIEYMPYRGPEVAAFDPNQVSAFQNNADAARAFGFNAPTDAMAGMPEATTYAGGMRGYDSMSLYNQALEDVKNFQPGAWNQYQSLFGQNVPTTSNPYPVGNPSGGGAGGTGPGGKDLTYAETLAEMGIDPADAPSTTFPSPGDQPSNYIPVGNPHLNASNPMNSPGHPSNQNYNYTPKSTLDTTMPYVPSDDGAFDYGSSLSSRLDSKGATPTYTAPYENPNIGARDIHANTNLDRSLQAPLDEIIEKWRLENMGK